MDNKYYLDEVLKNYGQRVFSVRNAPSDAVYIGRGKGSIFGNPFPMNGESTREQVCIDYRNWLAKKIKQDKIFASKVKELHNKNVKCFCSNGTTSREEGARWCHGHTLLAVADYLKKKES